MANILNTSSQSIIRPIMRTILGNVAQGIVVPPNLDIGYSGTLLNQLVSWYRLEELTGVRYDAHGVNNLSDIGSVGQASGRVGQAANMSGANYLSVSAGHGMHAGSRDFSLSTWFFTPSTASISAIAAVATNSNPSALKWALQLDGSTFKFYVPSAGAYFYADSLANYTPSTWHHFYCDYTFSTNIIGMRMDNGTYRTGTGPVTPNASDGTFTIGAMQGAGRFSTGRHDETAFWTRTLTTSEQNEVHANLTYPG